MCAISQVQMLRVYAELTYLAASVEIAVATICETSHQKPDSQRLTMAIATAAELQQHAAQALEHGRLAMLDVPKPNPMDNDGTAASIW